MNDIFFRSSFLRPLTRIVGRLVCALAAILGLQSPAYAVGEAINGFPKWEERVIHAWINRARSDPQVEMTSCGAACGEKACYSPIGPLSYDLNLNHAARFHSDELLRQSYFAHDSACTVVSNINSIYPATCDGSASCACVGGVKACSPTCTTFGPRVQLFGGNPSGEIIASPTDPNQAFYLWLYENSASTTCAFSSNNGHRWLILKSTGAVGAGVSGPAVGDFGSGAAPAKIPSGSHYPRQSASVDVWANWFDAAAPSVARVNVDGVCTTMTLGRGTPTNGAFKATLTNVASGCHRYYFEFKDAANQAVTFPTTGSLGIGAAGVCADWDTSRATSCDVPPQVTLTVVENGTGSGTVTSVPTGINCPADCTEPYNVATLVNLTATPNVGSLFSGWSGGGCSGVGTCVLTMNSATTVTATFTAITVPSAPTILSATPGNTQVTVAFTPSASDGGSPIAQYTAQCAGSPTAFNIGLASPIIVSSMINGQSYNCGVVASNAIGNSPPSGQILVTPNSGLALSLQGVKSRKVHAGVTYDLPIDFSVPSGGLVTVEPRVIGAAHQIIFQYNAAITSKGTLTAIDSKTGAVAAAVSAISGNDIIVTLPGVADNRRVTISLNNVNGVGVNSAATVGFLVGDVNGTRAVTASDVAGVKVRSGQAASAGNFKFDVNATGNISATSVTVTKARSGLVLP